MKCPQCTSDQKIKDGMICSKCGYLFALNPKEKLKISDLGFKKAVEALSGPEGNYFTYNQLYAQIHKHAVKSARGSRVKHIIISCIVGVVATLFLGTFFRDFTQLGARAYVIVGIIAALVVIIRIGRRPHVSDNDVRDTIRSYLSMHPIERLADGERFKRMESDAFDREFLNYAPERILIVERNDMADMLLLNRFHVENKTLVVSAHRYPPHAFRACQEFLVRYPDLPVEVMHDASMEGLRLKERLQADKQWHLQGREIKDLGLFAHNVDKLKNPIWLPAGRPGAGATDTRVTSSSEENIQHGLRMPLDIAPPRAMMGAVGLAMLAGMALLSDELLAEQRRLAKDTTSDVGGGFG